MNEADLFDKGVRDSFLKVYRGWIEICRPQRIKNGGCSECPLDGLHLTSICNAFQDIGRSFEKSITTLIRKVKTEKDIKDRRISEFQEFRTKYACPGPDLFQRSDVTEAET